MSVAVRVTLSSVLVLCVAMFCARPAAAQITLGGTWQNFTVLGEDFPERIAGPEIGDYLGVPINAAGRLRADTWDASLLSLPDYQCRVHPSDYVPSFGPIRIWEEFDQQSQKLLAIHIHNWAWSTERVIWMDGRPHPGPHALYSSQGFSTGKWDGPILVVTTDHLKDGWIRRNGVPRSEKATVTEQFIRHGNHLTIATYIQDPAYLSEPFVRTRDYVYDVGGQYGAYPCESVVEVPRPEEEIPSHLPGTNTALNDFAKAHGVPIEAARGGAATMYPQYEKTVEADLKAQKPAKKPAAH